MKLLSALSLISGTVGAPSFYLEGDTSTGFYRIGANNVGFTVAGSKVLDISANGTYFGPGTPRTIGSLQPKLELEYSGSGLGAAIVRNIASGTAPSTLYMVRSAGAGAGSVTTVANGYHIGALRFVGADGSTINSIAAEFLAVVDGTVSTGIVPGAFLLRAANSSGTLVDSLRVDAAGADVTGALTVTGNASIGATLNTWSTGSILQIGSGGSFIFGDGYQNIAGTNAYYNSGWLRHGPTYKPTQFNHADGVFRWYASDAGTAGSAITWSQLMTLDAASLAVAVPTSITGNLTLSGTGRRITGDFSNATFADRTLLQSSTTNGVSIIGAIPNGTGATAGFAAFNSSDPGNASFLYLGAAATYTEIGSGKTGTGTALPMLFSIDGSERARIDTSGNVGIGTNAPAFPNGGGLVIYRSDYPRLTLKNSTTGDASGDGGGLAMVASDLYLSNEENAALIFRTNGQERGSFNASGYASFLNGVLSDAGYYDFTVPASHPAAPAAGKLRIHARSRAGRYVVEMEDPDGQDSSLQPALFGNNVEMWLPGTGTTVAINFGTSWLARNSGTGAAQAHPTLSSTNKLTSMKRATFSTGTTATGSSGIVGTQPNFWRGNAAGLGGFFFYARLGIETWGAGTRIFVGLSGSNAALNAEPSSLINAIGFGCDSGDTEFQFMTRGSVSQKTALGIAQASTKIFDVTMYCPPNSSSIFVRVVEEISGTVCLDNVEITGATILPGNTTFLYPYCQIQSTSGTTAKLLALNKMYIESDF